MNLIKTLYSRGQKSISLKRRNFLTLKVLLILYARANENHFKDQLDIKLQVNIHLCFLIHSDYLLKF